MSCNRYEKILSEAVAGGDPVLSDALREHLSSCAGCRQFLAREQALFSAINASVRAYSNPEPPASLLPRLRSAIVEQPVPTRHVLPLWAYAFATASVILGVFAAQNWSHRTSEEPQVIAEHPAKPTIGQTESAGIPASGSPNTNIAARVVTNKPLRGAPRPQAAIQLQVLVPAGEEALLFRYYEAMRRAPDPRVMTTPQQNDPEAKPAPIPAIQIAQLEIKNLDESGDVSR